MAKHPKTTALSGFKGINNQLRPERTPPAYLKEALNVDLDKLGGVHKREGYSKVFDGDYHSLWSNGVVAFAVKDGRLVRISSSLQVEIDLNFETDSALRFDSVDGRVFFASDEGSYEIVNDTVIPWGILEPNPKPALMGVSGLMTAGLYQVAITFIRQDGTESGTGLAQKIQLPDDSGIMLLNIPVSSDPLVTHVRIYTSTPDGEVLYLLTEVANGTTTYTIQNVSSAVVPLLSFNRKPAPAGHLAVFAHNRAFIAQDNVLYFSDPYSYHWFDLHASYFIYPERIRAIMPVDNGMWVCADNIYYISNDDTDKMQSSMKEPAKVVEGTEVRIPGSHVFMENTPLGYKWLITSDRGIFICFNQGVILNMTEANYSFDHGDKGTGIFVQKDGIAKYVPIVQKKRDSDKTTVGDQVTAEIIRNGVVLED